MIEFFLSCLLVGIVGYHVVTKSRSGERREEREERRERRGEEREERREYCWASPWDRNPLAKSRWAEIRWPSHVGQSRGASETLLGKLLG